MRIGVLCSGGDAPGMNAVIRAVVRSARSLGHETVGIRRGFRGLIEGDVVELSSRDVGGILDRGGTLLLSSRDERFKSLEFRERAYRNMEKTGIDALMVLGAREPSGGLSSWRRNRGHRLLRRLRYSPEKRHRYHRQDQGHGKLHERIFS